MDGHCQIPGRVYHGSSQVLLQLHNAKRSFYRAFNYIFGKIGRLAGENVTIELLKIRPKCLPCMYYGLEACTVIVSHRLNHYTLQ